MFIMEGIENVSFFGLGGQHPCDALCHREKNSPRWVYKFESLIVVKVYYTFFVHSFSSLRSTFAILFENITMMGFTNPSLEGN